jgi:hypothetical protein
MPVVQRRNDNRVALRLHRGRRIFVVIPRLRDSHVPEWRERFFGAAGGPCKAAGDFARNRDARHGGTFKVPGLKIEPLFSGPVAQQDRAAVS